MFSLKKNEIGQFGEEYRENFSFEFIIKRIDEINKSLREEKNDYARMKIFIASEKLLKRDLLDASNEIKHGRGSQNTRDQIEILESSNRILRNKINRGAVDIEQKNKKKDFLHSEKKSEKYFFENKNDECWIEYFKPSKIFVFLIISHIFFWIIFLFLLREKKKNKKLKKLLDEHLQVY